MSRAERRREGAAAPTTTGVMDRSSRRLRIPLVVAVAIALAWVVARSGSAPWILLRVGVVAVTAAATVRLLRDGSRPRVTGAVLVAIGLLSFGIGLGIAPAWIAKTGVTVTSVAGIVLLVGGLALSVLGYTDLVAGLPQWARVLEAGALVVLAGFTALTLSVAVAATNVPPTEIGATPASVGLEFRDVELETEDGVRIAAWYVPSRNGAAVVVLHGAGATRSAVLDEMRVLAAHGYGVLAFDARGHGESGGRAMDFGWFGDRDAFPAIAWLAARSDVVDDRIALLGLSMGGEEAIGVAPFDARVDAVVAEGATGRTAADDVWMRNVYGIRGSIQAVLNVVRFGITDLLTASSPPIALRDAVTRMAGTPVLLIAAGSVPDEGHAAIHIRAGSPDTVQIWEVPDAGHVEGLAVAPGAWEERVIGFLDRVLLAGS